MSKFTEDDKVIVTKAYEVLVPKYVDWIGVIEYIYLDMRPSRYLIRFDNGEALGIDEEYLEAVIPTLSTQQPTTALVAAVIRTAEKVIDDCKAVGVHPFGLPALENAIEAYKAAALKAGEATA